ncbi:hypothetical protein Q5752_000474 [Cryptotrichosporon argae]
MAEPSLEPEIELSKPEPIDDEPLAPTPQMSSVPTSLDPPPGTVLISTVVPSHKYLPPDWAALSKRLPFGNPQYAEAIRPTGQQRSGILNIAAEKFISDDAPARAITIRLEGVDDRVWRWIKAVMDEVERAELVELSRERPELLRELLLDGGESTIASPAKDAAGDTSAATATVPSASAQSPLSSATGSASGSSAVVTSPAAPTAAKPPFLSRLRAAYADLKRTYLSALAARAPPLRFPHFRLAAPIPAIADVLTDKWAPRLISLSTRPLVKASEVEVEGDGEVEYDYVEEPAPKRRKGQDEDVAYEMPDDLGALDERVEAGVQRGPKRGKAKVPRGEKGAVCEGCARNDVKVWRRGPGGASTLCNACGMKYLAGELGELLAPNTKAAVIKAEPGADGADAASEAASGPKIASEPATAAAQPMDASDSLPVPTQVSATDAAGTLEPSQDGIRPFPSAAESVESIDTLSATQTQTQTHAAAERADPIESFASSDAQTDGMNVDR